MPAIHTLHLDRPILELDVAYVEGRAHLVGYSDAELVGQVASVIGIGHHWDAERFARFPNLRVISRMGIGYDNVDLDAARAAGVVVCNGPDSPTVSTAEHAMMLLLAVTKELPIQQLRSSQGLGGPPVATSLELDGSTLGLVGLGRIGVRVARAALGLGMRVIANDPGLEQSPVHDVELVGLDELFATSHVISLHAPSLPATRHMINAESIASMRRGVYLVNCARGPLIDQDALVAAIDSAHVAGAALDVTEPEPLPIGHPLLTRPNVIITPHIASSTAVGRRRLFEHAIDNALAVLDGRPASVVT
ncbi:NAD(P)-dependent oxidoreductase [Ilumatobacter sp.]|uniref:NAD(P)-dependent oxidoreductase n=1 Tax=Ilumatobacter sp. TaxID=1967498 RepID=UPI00375294E4